MNKEPLPSIIFYDQDFADLYERSWVWIEETIKHEKQMAKKGDNTSEIQLNIDLFDSCLSSLSLCYSNLVYSPFEQIDYFYQKQEENGAIRAVYNPNDDQPLFSSSNPEGVCIPFLPYVEFFLFHKAGNKKRLKEIVPHLDKYFDWLQSTFMMENGLFSVPIEACRTGNIPREKTVYPIDFNASVAANALYFSFIGDILNDKELSFKYKRLFFALKTKINSLMWNAKDGFYYDLDSDLKQIKLKLISAYWTLIAEIPNDEKALCLIEKLKNPEIFGSENPFPSVSMDSSCFKENVKGYCGAVVPSNIYIVVKGLEKYEEFVFARECVIRFLYFMMDTLQPDENTTGDVWEAYLPLKEGVPEPDGEFPRKQFLPQVCLATITMMIENVVGINVSLPKKTVDWTVSSLEEMGIQNLSLKKNLISIMSSKNTRGWEIRLESEKLYYFTIEIIDEEKKKTLPIPSGKCSMLIDKL